MRATFIGMCVVLAAALALCFFSMSYQEKILDEADDLRNEAISLVDAKDHEGAEEKITQLAHLFKDKLKILEMIASHNDLHEAYMHIVSALISLEVGDLDDTYQELTLLGETIAHLKDHEAFSLSNLY